VPGEALRGLQVSQRVEVAFRGGVGLREAEASEEVERHLAGGGEGLEGYQAVGGSEGEVERQRPWIFYLVADP
jgi:hypothetical protein